MEYYIFKDDAQQGPYTFGQLRSMWASGTINAATLYWTEGAADWNPLREISSRLDQQSDVPSAAGRQYPTASLSGVQPVRRLVGGTPVAPVVAQPAKSRGVYIILGIFLGLAGVHNFYAGYYRKGAVQLVLTITLGWTIIVLLAVIIWVVVELCTVTEDENGIQFV